MGGLDCELHRTKDKRSFELDGPRSKTTFPSTFVHLNDVRTDTFI